MEGKVDFRKYKEDLISLVKVEAEKERIAAEAEKERIAAKVENENITAKVENENITAVQFAFYEPVRILIWSLVQSLQEHHLMEECPQKVTHQNIVVCGHQGFIIGECVPYDEQIALDNYEQLRNFVTKDLFGDFADNDLPFCVSHFLNCLVDQPLAKQHLIAWHVGHLSTAFTICFINNVAHALSSAKPEERTKIRHSIDAINVEADWENCFIHQNKFLKEKFLKPSFKKPGGYKSSDPSDRSYLLLQYLHDVVDHAGVKRRTTLKAKHYMGYQGWMSTSTVSKEEKASIKKRAKGENEEPDVTLNALIGHIFNFFPTFLTLLQSKLHENGVVQVVSPCPDKILHF